MNFCTECGKKYTEGQPFCTGCGNKLLVETTRGEKLITKPERELNRNSNNMVSDTARHNKRTKSVGIIVSAVLILGLISGGVLYFLSQDKAEVVSSGDESGIATNEKVQHEESQTDDANEEEKELDKIARALEELESLPIQVSGLDILLGEWEIQREDGGAIFVGASKIPDNELEKIFRLYDQRELEPLETWAEEVFYIVSDLGDALDSNWSIYVGNDCAAQYPESLSSEELMNNSGSCGYSIPVLSGSNKENLALVFHEGVFSSSNEARLDSDFVFHDSSNRLLTKEEISSLNKEELSIARNEIFARYGYVFQSENLRDYFSRKSWYHPNPHFDNSQGSLNEIEKYNVDLIKKREEQLQ